MGRYISCKINGQWELVWKYGFGTQSSEMYRIHEELGVGEYHPVCIQYQETPAGKLRSYAYLDTRRGADGDILILRRADIEALGEWLDILSEMCERQKDPWFVAMIEAIQTFVHLHADQEEFLLEGEF